MNPQINLVFFDLETTGLDKVKDKIIEIGLYNLQTGARFQSYVNPGIPIPAKITEITGITDGMVKDAPKFEDIAQQVRDFIGDNAVAGQNVLNFDIPFLASEFGRANIYWPEPGLQVYDTMLVEKAMYPVNLGALYARYCNEPVQGWHGAMSDTMSCVKIYEKQAQKALDIKQLPEDKVYSRVPVDPYNFVIKDADGDLVINWGKFRGVKVRDNKNAAFFMMYGNFPPHTKNAIKAEIRRLDEEEANDKQQ